MSKSEQRNMYRIKLGKTKTEFFSEKGNLLLKRIWLNNNLDEEMIFSSWIGPNKALLRQKVSDYIQNYLLHRSILFPARRDLNNFGNEEDKISFMHNSKESTHLKYQYYEKHMKATLTKNYREREEKEKDRVVRSVLTGGLPAISGFEWLLNDPVFLALEMERRMVTLSKVPFPYDEDEFHKFILPILTRFAIAKEKKERSKCRANSSTTSLGKKLWQTTYDIVTTTGFHSDSNLSSYSDYAETAMGVLSSSKSTNPISRRKSVNDFINAVADHNEFSKELDSNEECEACCGAIYRKMSKKYDNIEACTCNSDEIWKAKNNQTASALFQEASEIVNVCARERSICTEYMEQYYSKNWMNK